MENKYPLNYRDILITEGERNGMQGNRVNRHNEFYDLYAYYEKIMLIRSCIFIKNAFCLIK